MSEIETGFHPVGAPTFGMRDPLADRPVTITIQVAPPPAGGSRDERICLVAVGVVGSVPAMGEGRFGDLAALLRQVWNAHGEASAAVDVTPPAAPGVLAEQRAPQGMASSAQALPMLETTEGEVLAPLSPAPARALDHAPARPEQPRLEPQAAPPPPQEDLLDFF